jgi:hypothetical protein
VPHVPSYTRELLEIRRAGLAPDGDFVIVTNDWPLAKLAREAESVALVIRVLRDAPDLRGCYALKVILVLTTLTAFPWASSLARAPNGSQRTIREFLQAIAMHDGAPAHELEAVRAIYEPIAEACEAARVTRASVGELELWERAFALSRRQAEREKATR